MALETWRSFFQEIANLATTGERHYGVCNANYCNYMIERIELSIQSSQTIVAGLSSVDARQNNIAEITGYLEQLIELLRSLLDEWKDYQMVLDSNISYSAYHVPVEHTSQRGRPKFHVHQDQIEYLVSLSFTWNEIALLLGISRTTLYRYI